MGGGPLGVGVGVVVVPLPAVPVPVAPLALSVLEVELLPELLAVPVLVPLAGFGSPLVYWLAVTAGLAGLLLAKKCVTWASCSATSTTAITARATIAPTTIFFLERVGFLRIIFCMDRIP